MSLIMEGFLEEIIFKLAFGKKKSRAWQTNPNSRGITQRKKRLLKGTEVQKEQCDLG